MNKAITSLLILVICPALIFAQTGRLKGTIKDSIGSPIESATVLVKDAGMGTTTDVQGNFLIENVNPGTYSVVVNMVGYNTNIIQATRQKPGGQLLRDRRGGLSF